MGKKQSVKEKNKKLKEQGKQLLNYGLVLRAFPNEKQEILINKTFGCSRLINNKYLADRKEYYTNTKETISISKYKKEIMNPLKKTDEYAFLKEVDKFALESALENVEDAYDKFFKHQNKFPKFKSKKNNKKSYTTKFTNNNIEINLEKQTIQLPKLGEVLFVIPKKNEKLLKLNNKESRIIKATIKREGNRYYISLCIEEIIPIIKNIENKDIDKAKVIGIDLGLKDYAIISDGTKTIKIDNPKFLRKSEKKLAKLQIKLSKKLKNSKNYLKLKEKINLLHTFIANQRKDFTHQLSRRLVNENQIIVVENLNIKGMVKNKHLSKAISDAGWYKFITYLNYKLAWAGKKLIKVDRFYASSKICSHCGEKNIMLTLSDREWTCSKCNTTHDRDENASLNIREEGLRLLGLA